MRRVNLDRESERIKRFVRSLPLDPDGSILELDGKPIAQVLPPPSRRLNKARLKAAILRRRDRSRELNAEWEPVDREIWSHVPRQRS